LNIWIILFLLEDDLFIFMSAEKISSTEVNDLPPLATPEKSEEVSSSGRVDINVILKRARKVKEKETLTNLVFAGLTLSLIFVVGLILSF
jgi:preprotein translocase subunit Sss1